MNLIALISQYEWIITVILIPCIIFLLSQWKKNIIWKTKREYFEKNQGKENSKFWDFLKNESKRTEDRFNALTARTEDRFNALTARIDARNINYAQDNSPLSISEAGEKVNKKIRVDLLLNKYQDEFFGKLNFPFEKEYQIQKECFDLINSDLKQRLTAEEWEKLEEVAYNEGVFAEKFFIIFQILLRDMAIKHNDKIKKHEEKRKKVDRKKNEKKETKDLV